MSHNYLVDKLVGFALTYTREGGGNETCAEIRLGCLLAFTGPGRGYLGGDA